MSHRIGSFFKDKHGKTVAWQSPNPPLWGWIYFSVFAHIFSTGKLHHGFARLATASIIVWAYLEVTSGASPFRRVLGAVVLLLTVSSFFHS